MTNWKFNLTSEPKRTDSYDFSMARTRTVDPATISLRISKDGKTYIVSVNYMST